jgi:hypothetical protein
MGTAEGGKRGDNRRKLAKSAASRRKAEGGNAEGAAGRDAGAFACYDRRDGNGRTTTMNDATVECEASEDDIFIRDLPDAALERAAGAAPSVAFSVYMCTVVDCTG